MSSEPIPISRHSEEDLEGRAHVVCGTDFTPEGAGAADVATAFAQARGEPLALVHVVNEPARGTLPGELRDSLALFERKRLHDEMQRLTSRGAEVVQQLRTGEPDEALIAAAQRPFADLLVLSCGARKAKEGLLGRVVEQVAETAPIPTLIVRQAGALLAWLSGQRSLRVFVAADLTPASESAIRWAIELRKLGKCEVTIVHIEHADFTSPGITPDGMPALASAVAQIQRSASRSFRVYVRRLLRGEKARVLVAPGWGVSDAHVIHLAKQERTDLIVTGTHHRHGFDRLLHHSVSRGLLHYAPMNVACIPTPSVSAESRT